MTKKTLRRLVNRERVSVRRADNGFISVQLGNPVFRVYTVSSWRKFCAKVDAMIMEMERNKE